MADSDKDSIQCLVCNSKIGVSTRNSIRIFDDSSYTVTERSLVDIISAVLEIDINEESVHSLVICKKCFKLFNEVKQLCKRRSSAIFSLIKTLFELTEKFTFPFLRF